MDFGVIIPTVMAVDCCALEYSLAIRTRKDMASVGTGEILKALPLLWSGPYHWIKLPSAEEIVQQPIHMHHIS